VTGSGLVIRPLSQDDDLEAEVELRRRAFGPMDDAERGQTLAVAADSVAAGRHFGAFDGERMIATARYLDRRQWWHGRSVPMAGVAGVKVTPEVRGRGVGKALMTELLGHLAGRGYPVSVLYPATTPIYRSLGWELAGGLYHAAVPARALGSLLPPDVGAPPPPALLRRASPDDAAEVIEVIGAAHAAARHCGPATRAVGDVRRWLSDPHLFSYLASDGFLAYRWHDGNRELLVECAVAGSAPTTRGIWAVVASHASIAERVRALLSPDDPVAWLTREADLDMVQRTPWMLRILDAPAAIGARGFPASAVAAAVLRLDDSQIPANSGLWMLEVSGGKGTLNRCQTDDRGPVPPVPPVALGARGFAALFAGIPLPTLRLAGLAAGGDRGTDDALDCAFSGTAFLLDYF
jgi:predicted N-acetyltransferase YhbS